MNKIIIAIALLATACDGAVSGPAPVPPDAPSQTSEWLCVTSWTDASGAHTHSDAYITTNTPNGEADFEQWKAETVTTCEAACSCPCSITCQPIPQ